MVKKLLSKPKAIFFDWDGTLVDSYGFLNDAHGYVLDALGFPPFYEGEYREYFGKPRDVLYPLIYKDKCEEAKVLFKQYIEENSHKIKPLNGSELCLQFLKNSNIGAGVVSNKQIDFIRRDAEHLKWHDYFKVIVGGGDAPVDKPSSQPLKYALNEIKSDLLPEQIWFVGDTDADLACAQEFGCVSVFVDGHKDSVAWKEKYKPDLCINDCSDLQKILVAL